MGHLSSDVFTADSCYSGVPAPSPLRPGADNPVVRAPARIGALVVERAATTRGATAAPNLDVHAWHLGSNQGRCRRKVCRAEGWHRRLNGRRCADRRRDRPGCRGARSARHQTHHRRRSGQGNCAHARLGTRRREWRRCADEAAELGRKWLGRDVLHAGFLSVVVGDHCAIPCKPCQPKIRL